MNMKIKQNRHSKVKGLSQENEMKKICLAKAKLIKGIKTNKEQKNGQRVNGLEDIDMLT